MERYQEIAQVFDDTLPRRVQFPALIALIRIKQHEPSGFGGHEVFVVGIGDGGTITHHFAVLLFFVLLFSDVFHLRGQQFRELEDSRAGR